jgi:2-amino-4-hydroxy-6-hydroxymethyldihydropteridine diphosphokinase
MAVVYLGLGSNIGDKEKNIKQAVTLLKKIGMIKNFSSLYETEPVGYRDQDWFLNGVIEIDTPLKPVDLLFNLQSIEQEMGRKNDMKNGPRIIDIDILFYDDLVMSDKGITIPHPRLHERLFVLQPMMDVNPDLIHPKFQKTIEMLCKQVQTAGPKVRFFKEMVFNCSSHS